MGIEEFGCGYLEMGSGGRRVVRIDGFIGSRGRFVYGYIDP